MDRFYDRVLRLVDGTLLNRGLSKELKKVSSKSLVLTTAVFFTVISGNTAYAEVPNLDTLWKMLQAQQSRIETLENALVDSQQALAEANQVQEKRIDETEITVAAAVEAMEVRAINQSKPKSRVGGYGEVHYNNLDSKNEIDLHRYVMFFSHQFSDNLSFYSELEVEHSISGDGQVGEVEVEQAFVQWDYASNHRAKAGVFLLPIGIINETHEPDTFYGVERNSIEKNIIPATWWEAGLALDGEIAPGWHYDLALHSGLKLDVSNVKASKRSSIRLARQKVGEAPADDLAYTARIRYSGIPGVQWSASLQYQSDLTQSDPSVIGIGSIDGRLFETDLSISRGQFGLKALYARWDLDDRIEGLNPGADLQTGWYIEPSFKYNKLGLFARFGQYDLNAGRSSSKTEKQQLDFGINYWLHDNVVIKADYQIQDNENGSDNDGFNLGVGYSF